MGSLVVVGIEDAKSIDKIALALRVGSYRLGFLDCGEPERKVRRRRWVMRIVEIAERNAPVGNAALRVGFDDLFEYAPGFAVPEGMLVAHGAVEPSLRDFIARRRKVDGS